MSSCEDSPWARVLFTIPWLTMRRLADRLTRSGCHRAFFIMPYRICKSIEVENGHMLSKHPDQCRFPHGHSRKVEIVLEADDLDDREMVCDFKLIKSLLGSWLDRFDHALCMNTADPAYAEWSNRYGDRIIGFENQDPTTELMARVIFDHASLALKNHSASHQSPYPLRNSVRLVRVRVWETSSSWAEYEAP